MRTTVATLLLLAASVTGCEAQAGGSWQEAAPAPIAPRWMPVAVWTGTEAVFLGGGTEPPCPPDAGCVTEDPMARDGAAYDPETDSWRRVADAPTPIGYWFRPVAVGDTVVLYGDGRWLAYDVGTDTWASLPTPPERAVDTGSISAVDGRVHALAHSGRVLVLDLDARTWSRLPADDQRPALDPFAVRATDAGVFVCGEDPTTPDDGDTPHFTVVDRWDGTTWSRFPETGAVGNLCQHWTGEHLASNDIQTAPGLDGNPPYGGRLDPATGEWALLPGAPDVEDRVDGWSLPADDGPLMSGWGYVYDDAAETWTPIGRPETDVDVSQSAVWADGRLVVFGGVDEETGYRDVGGLSDQTWIWTS